MATARARAMLREILRLLLDEREDTQLLYIPRGEEGMRRMIDQLLALRTPGERDDALYALLDQLKALDAQEKPQG